MSPDTHSQKRTASLLLLLSGGALALSAASDGLTAGDERGEDEAGKNPPLLSAWKCPIILFSPHMGRNRVPLLLTG